MSTTAPILILLLEDSRTDAALEERALKKAGLVFTLNRVETKTDFQQALTEHPPNVILADYSLPAFDGLSALQLARARCPEVPFILVSGNRGEELAVESLQCGATDYVLKSALHRLAPAVERALLAAAKQRELKLARETLETTTTKLNRLLADSPVVIYSWKIDGPNLVPALVSENVQKLLGYSVTETLEPDWWSTHLHPDEVERVLADVAVLLAEGELLREYRIRHRDGAWRWIADTQRVICDAQGVPAEVAGVWTDITERKAAARARANQDFQYRQLVEALPVALYTTDEHGHIRLFNEAAGRLWGRDPELDHDRWCGSAKIFQPDGQPLPLDQCPMAVAIREDRPVRGQEILVERPDGTRRNVMPHPHPMHDTDGKLIGAVNLLLDITDAKKAASQLELRDSALRAAAEGILITDTAGRIEWVNPALCQQTGYPEAELLGHTPRRFKSGKYSPDYYRNLWDTILAGTTWTGQMVNRRKDGSLYHEESTITPVKNAAGEVTHFIAIKRDVTDEKQAESEIKKLAAFPRCNPNPVMEFRHDGMLAYANEAAIELAAVADCPLPQLLPPDIADSIATCLKTGQSCKGIELVVSNRTLSWSFFPITEQNVVHGYATDITERLGLEEQFRQSQKMEAVGQLSSGVAHDFNNLLAVIMGHAELAQMEGLKADQIQESLQEVWTAAERAAGLTRQLLTFSRKQPMEQASTDLNRVVTNMTNLLRRLLGEHIELEFKPDPGLPAIKGDTGMLEQVVMNLAVNARDAMPHGGRLTLTTVRETITEEYVGQHLDTTAGEYVCLRVRDTGTGMSKAVQARIFEPFFTTKEAGKGTGLGMATVFGIVKQHGGWVRVYSELDEGTVFNVYLPAEDQEAAQRTTPATATPAGDLRGGETVLLVEDESSVRQIAETILTRAGYQVLAAPTGPEALQLWQQHPHKVQLLITDMIMPGGMTGRDVAAALLQDRPDLRIMFSSGYTTDAAGKEFDTPQNSRFLQKPYAATKLLSLVRACLDARSEPCRNPPQKPAATAQT